jgi:kynureninase
VIYLNGNSLGRLPKRTAETLGKVIYHEWGTDLIKSWNKSWFNKNIEIGNKIARTVGAEEGEVIVSDNTSSNLYKLAKAAIQMQSPRKTLLTDTFNFPSDLYIMQGVAKEHQLKLKMAKSKDGLTIHSQEILSLLDQDTALLSLTHVAFKSAFMYDIESITSMAHEVGALTLWDLSHSTGAVPLNMKQSKVDMAVGCTYKYLNGGPGAPAFLYIKKDLQEKLYSPIQGWFGAANPFDFNLDYTPAQGINRFLSGTPSVLSLSAIESGVDLVLEAGVKNIRKKSVALSTYFIELVERELFASGFQLASPKEEKYRGSHVSLKHPEAYRINKALDDGAVQGCSVIADFRGPDNLRFGFSPLYNTYRQVYLTVSKLKQISTGKLYKNYNFSRSTVT